MENPGPGSQAKPKPGRKHSIGGKNQEVMFLGGGRRGSGWTGRFGRGGARMGGLGVPPLSEKPAKWETFAIPMPAETGGGKCVAHRGCGSRWPKRFGHHLRTLREENRHVLALAGERQVSGTEAKWTAHEISGKTEGVKYDLVEMIDLDGDGDLDARPAKSATTSASSGTKTPPGKAEARGQESEAGNQRAAVEVAIQYQTATWAGKPRSFWSLVIGHLGFPQLSLRIFAALSH